MNADSGFDSEKFRNLLDQNEIVGNIKDNPRTGDTKDENYFHKRRFKIEQANA
ncbi:hypothetical protein ACI513_03415 [Chryseobacterium sp. M5]|uniref:hypothetical protein n=1 Tax=Chryseobacterium sp. M5 TaxID=3379128 RepID=UPI00385717E5